MLIFFFAFYEQEPLLQSTLTTGFRAALCLQSYPVGIRLKCGMRKMFLGKHVLSTFFVDSRGGHTND